MTNRSLEFSVVVFRDGARVGSQPLHLGPCIEDALFRGVLGGHIPNYGSMPNADVVPRWKEEAEGTVAALEVCCGDAPPRGYERTVFAPQVRAFVEGLTEGKQLQKGDVVSWEVIARASSKGGGDRVGPRLRRSPYPLTERRLAHVPPGVFEVEIAKSLLEELRQQVVEAGAVECAGLLVGRVFHDPARSAGAVQAIGSVEMKAGRKGASSAHFALDPDSFLAARDQAARRNDGAIPVGWFHSHPPCSACKENPGCRATTVFFSNPDIRVHMSAFSAPYMIALVAGKVAELPATQPGFRLFAWQNGLVTESELRAIDE